MKNQHFDDLIENLHDLKFKSEKDIYLFMLKHGKNKYVQVNKMTPIVGRPPLTREEILKDNPLILNIQPDVNELVSETIREIAIMGNGRAYLENVKKVFKEYDFHIPLPMKNLYIEFPRNGFGISKIELSNASKDELGSFDLLAIYLKVSYIDGKIKYDFFLQTKTYLNGNFQSKILNHISFNEKEFIQQITNDTTPIFHLIAYALSKGITDCYLAGVRQDRDITIKNEHGNKVKLKYPSSVIVYNHKQYEPNPESNVIIDYFGEGRNVIGHYRHYYLKDAFKKRIIGTDGYWILDITKPEEGGKNEFGDRPGTDFLKGRTYVNAQLKSKEHQTFITKYVKLENEKTGVNMRRNPMKEKTLEQERAFSEIYGYDTYFQSAEENEQGINSKDSIAFKNEVKFLIRELGVGVVLDLDSQMLSETAQVLLRRALDEEVPGFSTMFEKKSNPIQDSQAVKFYAGENVFYAMLDPKLISKLNEYFKNIKVLDDYHALHYAKQNDNYLGFILSKDDFDKMLRKIEAYLGSDYQEDVAVITNPKMAKKEYVKKYNKLFKQAESLPRLQAIKKLQEAYNLKKKYYGQKSNPQFIQDEEGFKDAEKILATFIKNAGGKDYAAELISQEIHGELEEFTARGLKGYMVYGNREALIYLDDIEEPFSLHVDYYGDRPVIVWG